MEIPNRRGGLREIPSVIFHHFLSTVGFSNEDTCNCCQLQGIGKLIKEKLAQGIFQS